MTAFDYLKKGKQDHIEKIKKAKEEAERKQEQKRILQDNIEELWAGYTQKEAEYFNNLMDVLEKGMPGYVNQVLNDIRDLMINPTEEFKEVLLNPDESFSCFISEDLEVCEVEYTGVIHIFSEGEVELCGIDKDGDDYDGKSIMVTNQIPSQLDEASTKVAEIFNFWQLQTTLESPENLLKKFKFEGDFEINSSTLIRYWYDQRDRFEKSKIAKFKRDYPDDVKDMIRKLNCYTMIVRENDIQSRAWKVLEPFLKDLFTRVFQNMGYSDFVFGLDSELNLVITVKG